MIKEILLDGESLVLEKKDLDFKDCPNPFYIVRLAAELGGKDK